MRASLVAGGLALQVAAVCAAIAPPAPAAESLLLAVRVNGIDGDDGVRVVRIAGRVALQRADWNTLHLRAAAGSPVRVDGQDYLPLDGLGGLRWRIDEASQTLVIDAPTTAFAGTHLRMDVEATAPVVPAATGAYGNYDVELQRTVEGGDPHSRQSASAQLEAGVSALGGSLATSALLLDDGVNRRATRLDATWTQESPRHLASLRAGDAISSPGMWGRALRFGGLQWSTDFSLKPGFLPFPLPSMHGEAALPSTVDIYVNNARRLQGDVPAGPFDVSDLPIVTGSGDVRLVVRDALGREQVVTQPYFVSPSLLKPGLHAFSVEAGAVREDYALRSDHYGRLMASATDRAGVSDSFTRELRVEFGPGLAAAGATGIWLLPRAGIATLGAMASHGAEGDGGAVTASLSRQGHAWNASVQAQRNLRAFSQLGVPARDALRSQATATVGGSVAGLPVGAGFVYQAPWNAAPQRLLSVNAGAGLGRLGTLGFYGLRDLGTRATTLSLSYSVSLDARTGIATGATRSGGPGLATARTGQVDIERNLPDGDGLGWRIDAQDDDRAQARLFARTDRADLEAGIARANRQTDVRVGAAGGVAWIDGTAFVSRRVDGAYAVVEVGDYPGITITRDNHPVARTDEHGRALVAGLRGNEVNHIGVEAAELPMDAAVDALDLDFIPPAHAGVVLRLPIERSRSATLRVLGRDGMPLPPGTVLRVAGRDASFPVGFDGRTFVSGLRAGTRLRARGPGADCGFALAVPEGDADDLPDVGNVVCQ